MRVLPSGRRYYDVQWEPYGLEVEIHGAQHLDAAAAVADALKANAVALEGKTLLVIPNFAFRVGPDPFLDQMAVVFRRRGWSPRRSRSKRAS